MSTPFLGSSSSWGLIASILSIFLPVVVFFANNKDRTLLHKMMLLICFMLIVALTAWNNYKYFSNRKTYDDIPLQELKRTQKYNLFSIFGGILLNVFYTYLVLMM